VVLVFELMEGGDLLKFLVRRKNSGQTTKASLTEEEARHVFYQVLSAVSYAHNQHICHRDLKLENILLKDNSINLVKIADFGLSDFYRPGSTMKSSCGTLSFLAPEVFKGTANAGPPLDVWSLGVILFALLCGRLPFEGNDLAGSKRPRDAVIKTRIMKCQYKIDDNLGPEAKDLLRRILQSDPGERLTIPEIFNHIWLRNTMNGTHYGDIYLYNAALHSNNGGVFNANGFYSSPFLNSSETSSTKSAGFGGSTSMHANQHVGSTVDLLLSVSPMKQKRSNSGSSQKEANEPPKQKFSNSNNASSNDLLMTVSEKIIHESGINGFVSESVSNTPSNGLFSSAINRPHSFKGCENNEHDTDSPLILDSDAKDDITLSAPLVEETKSTFKLIPLRRSNSSKREMKGSNYYDDDFLYSSSVQSSQRNSFTGQQQKVLSSGNLQEDFTSPASIAYQNNGAGNGHGNTNWRPSTTIATGGRRNILSNTNAANDDDSYSATSMQKDYHPTGIHSASNSRKDLLRSSPRTNGETYYKEKHDGLYDFKGSNEGRARNPNALSHSTDTSPFLMKGRSTTPTGHHQNGGISHPSSANKRKDGGHNITAGLVSLQNQTNTTVSSSCGGKTAGLSLSPPPNNLNGEFSSPTPPVNYSNSPVIGSMKGTRNASNTRMRF